MKDLFFFKLLRLQSIHLDKPLRKFRLFFDLLLAAWLLSLMLCNFYTENDFESLKSFLSVGMVIIKYVTLVIIKEDIVKLLKRIEKFWEIDVEDEQLTFFSMYTVRLIRFYKIFVSTGCVIFVTKAFLSKKLTVFGCCIPSQIPSPLFFLTECYLIWTLAMLYPGFNLLSCYLVSSVTVQFRLLNLKIQAIDLENASENKEGIDESVGDLKRKIEYHQFLIRYTEIINKTFSIPMAFFIALGVTLLCTDMYILSLNDTSFVNLYRAFITIMAVTSEFFMVFGLPAQLMMDQAEDTANTIYYECKWFLPNLVPIRKYQMMMIMRSQKSVRITALNYHVINKETIVLMLKTAYSFFAFLQTVA